MKKIKVIIFSFNRAVFLDTFLNSFFKNTNNGKYDVCVLYNATNDKYDEGYELLMRKFNCNFVKESCIDSKFTINEMFYLRNIYRFLKHDYYKKNKSNFKHVLLEIISDNNFENVVFFTDDSMIYKDFKIDDSIPEKINKNPENISFHLRFGGNYIKKPANIEFDNEYIVWDTCETKDKDWSYRFSVDGQIYNKDFLRKNLKKILFINPSTLEGNVNYYFTKKNFLKKGICFKESCLIGFEINKVQNICNNNNMNIDNKMLNDYYLKGYEMEYVYKKDVKGFRPELGNLCLKKEKEIIQLIL